MDSIKLPKLALGIDFESAELLKHACHLYAIEHTFEFKTLKSEKRRYTIACKKEGCAWYLHATSVEGTSIFRVHSFRNEHTCVGLNHHGHAQATATFLANKFLEKLKTQLDYRPAQIVKDTKLQLGIEITYSMALRVKEIGLAKINGTHEDAYKALPRYAEDILHTNPNSIAIIECYGEPPQRKFKRIFVCYGANAMGFPHCLPILGLDGTHLKSKYQGILLAATSVDANGSLFPLAYSVFTLWL